MPDNNDLQNRLVRLEQSLGLTTTNDDNNIQATDTTNTDSTDTDILPDTDFLQTQTYMQTSEHFAARQQNIRNRNAAEPR